MSVFRGTNIHATGRWLALGVMLTASFLMLALELPIKAAALGVHSNGCYDGFVLVPGDPTYGTSDFCVMEWEAKNVGGVATSEADVTPWVNIDQTDAATAASNACPNGACHLITDHEWMTIAANVERQPENWSGGSVGSGCLYDGNAYDTTCGYYKGSVDYGTYRNPRARYTLSNGSQIWDFSGNVSEWTDATIQAQDMPQPYGGEDYFYATNFGTVPYINPLANMAGLPGGASNWTSTQRLGGLYSSFIAGSTTTDAFLRGGYWVQSGIYIGPFSLILSVLPTVANIHFGFRVAQVPLAPSADSPSHSYTRSITMSSSAQGDTGVTYSVSFTADASYSLQSIVVDFCSNSPIIGQACTAPPGFAMGSPPTVSNLTIGGTAVSGWTASSQNSGRTLLYSSDSSTSVTPGTVITFGITGITNPSGISSYYARILTYSFASPSYSATDTDNFKESGELALNTAAGVNFTFEVPETLSFCVYKTTCGDTPSVVLGHGTPPTLTDSAVDTDSVQFAISTNAQSGVLVLAQGNTLRSGSNEIPPVDGGSGSTDQTITPGTAAFGMDIPSADSNYFIPYCLRGDGTPTGYYCFYDSGMASLYGTEIASGSGPLDDAAATLTFAATTSATTPAGLYTTTVKLIATSTF